VNITEFQLNLRGYIGKLLFACSSLRHVSIVGNNKELNLKPRLFFESG